MTIEKICVIGLGYIGLPTASVFALAGKSVIGVDCNAEIVAGVNQGRSHFAEPELAEILKQVVRQKRLSARTAPEPADVFIIAVPTPLAGRRPDLSAVFDALQSLIPVLTNHYWRNVRRRVNVSRAKLISPVWDWRLKRMSAIYARVPHWQSHNNLPSGIVVKFGWLNPIFLRYRKFCKKQPDSSRLITHSSGRTSLCCWLIILSLNSVIRHRLIRLGVWILEGFGNEMAEKRLGERFFRA